MADLAIKYGIGGSTLAANLGLSLLQADRIIATHKRTYSTYWAWAESQVKRAYQVGYISTSFGWTMAVDRNTRWNTVLNFPQQAACAELLRLTLVLAVERGLGPMLCAPHHDAFYLECKEEDTEWVSATLESCFQDAAEVVLSGRARLRLEYGTVRYPNHYCDEDGAEIWDIAEKFLAGRMKKETMGLVNSFLLWPRSSNLCGSPGRNDHRGRGTIIRVRRIEATLDRDRELRLFGNQANNQNN